MAANPRLTNKAVAPFFNPPNLSHTLDKQALAPLLAMI
jgi:hypothetical protein